MVLNLFDEFSDSVTVSSFSVSLLAAILLQALLKGTIAIEQQVAVFFQARCLHEVHAILRAWVVLFYPSS